MTIQEMINKCKENDEDFDIIEWLQENVCHVTSNFMFSNDGSSISQYASGGRKVEFMEKRAKDMGGEFFGFDWTIDEEDDAEEIARFKELYNVDPLKLKELNADNSYNWGYLGPSDFNFKTVEGVDLTTGQKKYFWFLNIHGGGDARNNYLMPYIFELSDRFADENWLAVDFYSGSVDFNILFNDGSKWAIHSEQDSDVPYYRLENSNVYVPKEMIQYQLLLNGKEEEVSNSMADDFDTWIRQERPDEHGRIDDLIDDLEMHLPRHANSSEEDKAKAMFEAHINATEGMVYGWTMMGRGTMRRVFNPKQFEIDFNKFMEAQNANK